VTSLRCTLVNPFVVVHTTRILVHPGVRCAHRLKSAALSPMSIKGSGRHTAGLGPIVGSLALFYWAPQHLCCGCLG